MPQQKNPAENTVEILVVEDSPIQAEHIKHLLEQNNYSVTVADTGEHALAFLEKRKPALIISDIIMPEMNGFELCRRIKASENSNDIPVILLTTLSDSGDVLEGLACGADNFITKPYSEKYFLKHVEQAIANRALQKSGRANIAAEILFWGKRRVITITAEKQQMLTLLISTYEAAVQRNSELLQTQDELRSLNEHLEDLVNQRTAALSTEITERKRAEEVMRESEGRYRALFESINDAVFVQYAEGDSSPGCFVQVNDVACQRLGYTREELLGLTSRDITTPEEYKRILGKREKFMSKGDIINETVHVTRDGRQIPVESSVRLFNYLGKRAAISIARDITERKQAEEDKEKLRTQLVQAQKMEAIGQLAGGIAHDFNNVLTAIVGYASLLRMKMKNDDPLRPNVEQILSATERAATLVRSLLTFSRKQILDPKPVRINDIVSSVSKLLASLLGEDITIETIYDARGPHVMADAGQIDQVLINIATNARDAMPKGGHLIITTDVTVVDDHYIKDHGYGVPGDYAFITVSDTGAGMDRATQERIFEPFFTTKEVGKGTGLGLSTAYGIIKQHSGFINCYSEPGKGTTFKIYLPLLKAEEKAEIARARKGAELTPRGSETVLVAEDDEAVRKLIVCILEQYGYTVYEAADGEEAVKVFMEHVESINLLLLDVIMPKKNGREAYREIEKIRPDMKALFTSGYPADIIEKRGLLEEGFEVILKPVTLVALLQKVRRVLDREINRDWGLGVRG